MLVYPSLLSIDQNKLKEELERLEVAKADALHYDVMDGKFVENHAGGVELLERVLEYSKLPINIHLMVEDVASQVELYLPFCSAGLCFHVEAVQNPEPLIKYIQSKGVKAGLVLDLPTELDAILPYLDLIDFVLIMTVKAGKGGQKFDEKGLEKAKKIRMLKPYLQIQIDGGIDEITAKQCSMVADVLDVGSAIFASNDYAEIIRLLKMGYDSKGLQKI